MQFLLLPVFLLISLNQNVFGLPDDCVCSLPALRRVVGGVNSNLVPFQVSVQHDAHICHGVILDEETVISSASCLNGLTADQVEVVAGISLLNEKSDQNTYKVDSINVPESFNIDVGENNTAILKLASKLDLQVGKVEKACLQMEDRKFETASFSGFGSSQLLRLSMDGTITPSPKPSNQLRLATFQPMEEVSSKTMYFVEPRGSKKDSVCVFDEGGSLYVTENGKVYTIGIADEALLAPDNQNVNLAIMCPKRSQFIKLSSIDYFVKKFASDKMCLIYEQ